MFYWTSDEHFDAKTTLEYSRRPFHTTDECNEKILENFNSRVTKNDITIHVGDFGNYDMIKYENGKHILVMGNHDVEEMEKMKLSFDEFAQFLKEKGFMKVIDASGVVIDAPHAGGSIKLYVNHFPLQAKANIIANPIPKDMIGVEYCIFGHIHERCMLKRFGLNVGVDCHHYYPISTDDVLHFREFNDRWSDEDIYC